jgi:chromosome segregation ATPase
MLGLVNISRWGLPALAAVLLGTTVYSLTDLAHERRQTQDLSATNTALHASLSQVQNELAVVSERIDQLAKPAPVEPEAVAPLAEPVAPTKSAVRVRKKARVIADVRPSVPKEDPRFNDLQSRLSDQQQQLDNTRQEIDKTREDLDGKLNSTHDELSGSIAKNHDELVELQKRGERNYYEFEIDKSKQFRKVGPLSVSLRKVNQKHKYYDLTLVVDDQQLEKKHLNLYEPMMLSTSDRPQPIELVVNEIHDNLIKGYISEPKYKKAELAQTNTAGEEPVLQQR